MNKEALITAVQAAQDGDWDGAHNITQEYSDHNANWIHAVLHKIEGDEWNSRYWYARTSIRGAHGKKYEDFSDANTELAEITKALNESK